MTPCKVLLLFADAPLELAIAERLASEAQAAARSDQGRARLEAMYDTEPQTTNTGFRVVR